MPKKGTTPRYQRAEPAEAIPSAGNGKGRKVGLHVQRKDLAVRSSKLGMYSIGGARIKWRNERGLAAWTTQNTAIRENI